MGHLNRWYFGEKYAKVYDLLYKDKNYDNECDYIVFLMNKHFRGNTIRNILDIACGTGGHAIPLAKKGYAVTARDISDAMIAIGREKAEKRNISISWEPGVSMQQCSHGMQYDCVICMFSSIGYLTNDNDLHKMFNNINRQLVNAGVFIFDFWNRTAVENSFSPTREKIVDDGTNIIKRISETVLDKGNNIAHINMHWIMENNGHIIMDEKDTHTCRYYGINDISSALKSAKLELLDLHPFMDEKASIDNSTWSITAVCRRMPS